MRTNTHTTGPILSPAGLGLASLADSNLERRFYSWLGLSGTRYVCTVFLIGEDEALSSFTEAAIIGVAHRDGNRRPVCVISSSDFAKKCKARVRAATALGVNEWHVHFSADERELAADLACQ